MFFSLSLEKIESILLLTGYFAISVTILFGVEEDAIVNFKAFRQWMEMIQWEETYIDQIEKKTSGWTGLAIKCNGTKIWKPVHSL